MLKPVLPFLFLCALSARVLKAELNSGVLGAKLMELGTLRYELSQQNIIHKDSYGYRAQRIDPESLKAFQGLVEDGDTEGVAAHVFKLVDQEGPIDENQEGFLQRQGLNEVKLGERGYRNNLDLELMAIKLEVH